MRRAKRVVAMTLTFVMMMGLIGILPTDVSAAGGKVKSVAVKNLDSNTLVLKKGKTFTLKPVVKTSGKVSKTVTYKSSKSKVVTVSSKGKLKAVKNGKATITISSVANKAKKVKVKVIVGTPVTKVTLNQSEAALAVGSSLQLKAGVSPKKASYKKVSYKSSDKAVATVSAKGLVQAKKAGTAKVTVKALDGSKKSAVCVVTVTDAQATTASTATTQQQPTTTASTPTTAEQPTTADQPTTEAPVKLSYEGYEKVWEDEFEGDSVNMDDWNVETHEPGWVNAELQEYTASGNYSVADGKLTIQPKKTVDASGNASYTSARLNTQGKHDYTYGLFEVVAKVPDGKGFLPAFWMMPTDENLYGQWPRCGEIDVMEVMGQETNKAYGTIHYGAPHSESQGTYTLSEGSFSEDYHKFSCEWEPGKITWYIDGVKFHEENDWYSKTPGQGTVAYPAPFDQPFYMILNLAVGGSWVGYPDEDQDINSQSYMIDSVRVYQKDSYDDSNVKKPDKEVIIRDPDSTGNYVNNGDFAVPEELTGEKDVDWTFLTTLGGEGSASIADNAIKIETQNAGTADYSIQLVQAGIPAEQEGTYKLTFDAYATEARTMKVDVSAPDRSFSRYLNDTEVALTTEKKTFEYEYTVKDENDANSRLEFNLGNTESKATVFISNVRLEKTAQGEISNDKTVLADGNYVYNGSFQEGEKRLGYWDISEGVTASVTGLSDGRRCKADVSSADASISQTALALEPGTYAYSMKAEGEAGKKIVVSVAGVEKEFTLTSGEATYKDTFTITQGDIDAGKDFGIRFANTGVYYIDDVRLEEDALIKNGKFNAGTAGYEVFVDNSASASYVVDSQNEDNALDLTIKNTADQEWKIQVKQNDVTLEKGQWYRLSFDAKSSIDRSIQYAIQRNGAIHSTPDGGEDWTPYVQETCSLSAYGSDGAYTTVSKEFKMKENTDTGSIFNIALGGKNITDQHRVCIDNILLEKIEEPEQPEIPAGANLLKNGDFASGDASWNVTAITSPGAATTQIADNKLVYSISNVGDEDWNIQLKQAGITLEQGASYQLKFKVTSTAARTIKAAFLNASYAWYGGADIALEADTEKEVECNFTVGNDDEGNPRPTDNDISFVVSMGKIAGVETPASDITLSDFSLVKVEQ